MQRELIGLTKLSLIIVTIVNAYATSLCAAEPAKTEVAQQVINKDKLKNDTDKLSYSIGVDLGQNFKKQNINVNVTTMSQGILDALKGQKLLLTDDQRREIIASFQKDLMTKRNEEFMKKSEENKTKGETFLSANKLKTDVVSLPSGLQYKIIVAGNGAKPAKEDEVTVEYTGTLIDGQVFDSTEKTGKPATFKVSQVIAGWTEVLQLMPTGSTWEVYIPAALAYGPRSVGGLIGPNETLIFKIHLISVQKTNL